MTTNESTPQFETYAVTDYDVAYLGTTLNFTLRDGVDTLIDGEAFGLPALVITTVAPAQQHILFKSGMQGIRITCRTMRKIVPLYEPRLVKGSLV